MGQATVELAETAASVASLQAESSAQQRELDSISQQLHIATEQNDSFRDRMHDAENEVDVFRIENEKLRQEIQDLRMSFDSAMLESSARVQQMDGELRSAVEIIGQLEHKIDFQAATQQELNTLSKQLRDDLLRAEEISRENGKNCRCNHLTDISRTLLDYIAVGERAIKAERTIQELELSFR